MNEPQHQTITHIEPVGDDMITIPSCVLIHTLSYIEALGSETSMTDKRVPTSDVTFMSDLISSVSSAWKDTKGHELIVTISGDKYHNPALIRTKYLQSRKDYGLKRR